MEFLTKLYESEYFAIILFGAITVLALLFIVIAIMGRKKGKKEEATAFQDTSAPATPAELPVATEAEAIVPTQEGEIPVTVVPEQTTQENVPTPEATGPAPETLFEPVTNIIDDFKPGEAVNSETPVVPDMTPPEAAIPIAPIDIAPVIEVAPVIPVSEVSPIVSEPTIIPTPEVAPVIDLGPAPEIAPVIENSVAPSNQFSSVHIDNATNIELPKAAQPISEIAPAIDLGPSIPVNEPVITPIENNSSSVESATTISEQPVMPNPEIVLPTLEPQNNLPENNGQ